MKLGLLAVGLVPVVDGICDLVDGTCELVVLLLFEGDLASECSIRVDVCLQSSLASSSP